MGYSCPYFCLKCCFRALSFLFFFQVLPDTLRGLPAEVIMSLTTVFLFSGTVFGWGAFSEMLQAAAWLTNILVVAVACATLVLFVGDYYALSIVLRPFICLFVYYGYESVAVPVEAFVRFGPPFRVVPVDKLSGCHK